MVDSLRRRLVGRIYIVAPRRVPSVPEHGPPALFEFPTSDGLPPPLVPLGMVPLSNATTAPTRKPKGMAPPPLYSEKRDLIHKEVLR